MGANGGVTCEKHKKDPSCVFCKGMHKHNLCKAVSCPKERLAWLRMQAYVSIAWHATRCLNAPQNLHVQNAIRNITPAFAMLSPVPLNLLQGQNPPRQSLLVPIM